MSHTVGFIGLGLMGKPMARNLLKKGFSVIVHSRSRGPVDELVKDGATAAGSPAEVARAAKHIITMLPDGPDVEKVLEGDDGVFGAMSKGTVIVDSSTIAPAIARRLAARAKELGASMLDAPVSGGEIGAIDGTLTFMVGGDAGALESVRDDPQRDGQARAHRPRRRVRRRPDLQGLQSDRAGRHDVGGRRSDRACRARPASIR